MKNNFFFQLFILSWQSLKANLFRSFLTTLGIIIGTATIIIVVALGEGAKRDIEAQYSNMSVTTILVNAPTTGKTTSKLSIDDIPLVKEIATVAEAVPMLTGKVNIATDDNITNFSVVGTYPEFEQIANLEFVSGTFFAQEDEDVHSKKVILGATVAEELYGNRTPDVIGETVILGKKEFEIIGIVKYKGGAFGPVTIDESVFTPYSSAYRYVLGKNGKFSFNVNADSIDTLSMTMDSLSTVLKEAHNLDPTDIEDFRLKDMGETVASAQNSSITMAFLLGSVGFIVLLVGGIGIMNIMYVTVSERTKEIGVRKAIGAKDIYILTQFLFEAFILTMVGFVLGTIIAFIFYYLLLTFDLKIVFVWWSLPLAFAVTFAVGMFFGFAPAKKASLLNPIDALRYE